MMSLLLSACSTFTTPSTQAPRIEIFNGEWITLPQPADLALNLNATQIITAQYQTKIYTSQVEVEANAQHVILLAVGAWGGEIFSINYDGQSIHNKALPVRNLSDGVHHTLTDFIFTYAPSSVIQKTLLTTKITLKESNKQRVFLFHGKPIIKIHYQYIDPWKGKVVLQNFALHYTISISTVSVKKGAQN